jgi:hypothetical protein
MANESQPAGRRSIQGVYELGHVLHVVDRDLHGFSRNDIDRVEYFWTFGDLHQSSAGFVLGLSDGRRAYVDFLHWHAFEQVEDFRIEVEFLPEGQAHPDFSSPDEPLGGWSSDTAHLAKVLGG